MCGIAGVAFLGTLEHEAEVIRQKLAWYLITELLITTQTRGDDATGIATIFNDGNFIGLKMGVMATEFVARNGGKETDYDGFLNIWKKSIESPKHRYAKLCMAHCRKTTLGSVYDNDNNHPIVVEPIIGVHNGTITNHETIFEMLPKDRIGSVDSEAIFSLLYEYTDQGKKEFTRENILEATKRLHGTYAVVAANSNSPYQVAVFRDGRPLILNIIKPLNIIIFTSEEPLFETALFRYNKEVQLYDALYGTGRKWPMITKKDVDIIPLKDEHLSILNLTEVLPEGYKSEEIIPQYAIPRTNKIWAKAVYTGNTYVDGVWTRNRHNSHVPVTTVPVVTTPKKEEKDKDKDKITGFLWVEDSDAYKEVTEEQIKELEKIGSVEIIADGLILKITDITKEKTTEETTFMLKETKEDTPIISDIKKVPIEKIDINTTVNKTTDTGSTESGSVLIKQALLEGPPIKETTVAVNLWKDPESLKKARDYVSALPMVETEKEIAEIMGLSSVKDVDNLPLVALVNKIRKITAASTFYDANYAITLKTPPTVSQTELANMGISFKEGKKRDVLVGAAKNLLVTLTSAAEEYQDNQITKKRCGSLLNYFTEKLAKSSNKIFLEDISPLFTPKDLNTNTILKQIYENLPSKFPKVEICKGKVNE